MVIAVDIRGPGEYRHFIYEAFKRITSQQSGHTFIFIFDKPGDPAFIFSRNVISVVAPPQKIVFLKDRKTRSVLKKYKADVFVTMQPVNTKVPQCFIAFDAISADALKKAKLIIADSPFSKKEITDRYGIHGKGVEIIYNGVDDIFQPLMPEERERIKEIHTEGNEYFLSFGVLPSGNLLNLLKAFSAFKKMQKSNMRLIIASEKEFPAGFIEKLTLFKYTNDVKMIPHIADQELATIMAAAYAMVLPVSGERYSYSLQGMKCNVPVIAVKAGSLHGICNDAALYIDADDQNDISDKMMILYKDENLRKQLIEKGDELAKKYSWDFSARALWKNIEKAAI